MAIPPSKPHYVVIGPTPMPQREVGSVETATSNVRRLVIEVDVHGDGYGVDRMYDEGAAGEFAHAAVRPVLLIPPGGGSIRAFVVGAHWHNAVDAPTTQNKVPASDAEGDEQDWTVGALDGV